MFTIVNIEYIIIIIKRFGMNFKNDKVFSRFTSHFSLKTPAFTLAEVLRNNQSVLSSDYPMPFYNKHP